MEPRQREQQRRRLGRGGSPGSGDAGTCPGGCWPQADLLSRSGLQPALPRSLEPSGSRGGSQAGCEPGLSAVAKGCGLLPTRLLPGGTSPADGGRASRKRSNRLPPTYCGSPTDLSFHLGEDQTLEEILGSWPLQSRSPFPWPRYISGATSTSPGPSGSRLRTPATRLGRSWIFPKVLALSNPCPWMSQLHLGVSVVLGQVSCTRKPGSPTPHTFFFK